MDINRRGLLVNLAASAALAMVGMTIGIGPALAGPDSSTPCKWHPLTQSLLQRARGIARGCVPDRAIIDRAIQQFVKGSGSTKPPVIKWMDTPTDAFD